MGEGEVEGENSKCYLGLLIYNETCIYVEISEISPRLNSLLPGEIKKEEWEEIEMNDFDFFLNEYKKKYIMAQEISFINFYAYKIYLLLHLNSISIISPL